MSTCRIETIESTCFCLQKRKKNHVYYPNLGSHYVTKWVYDAIIGLGNMALKYNTVYIAFLKSPKKLFIRQPNEISQNVLSKYDISETYHQ